MRCPDCNKFTSLTFEEPEDNGFDVSPSTEGSATVTGSVRIYRTMDCCGSEGKEANLDFDIEVDLDEWDSEAEEPADLSVITHSGEGHDLNVDVDLDQFEEGGGRYKASLFGATVHAVVTCSCGARGEGDSTEHVQASEMDELV